MFTPPPENPHSLSLAAKNNQKSIIKSFEGKHIFCKKHLTKQELLHDRFIADKFRESSDITHKLIWGIKIVFS